MERKRQIHQPKFSAVVFATTFTFALFFPLLFSAQNVGAQSVVDTSQRLTYEVVLEESEIMFFAKVAIVPNFSGRAQQFQGTIEGFPLNLEGDAFTEIIIETESLDTGSGRFANQRDDHMWEDLDSVNFPEIRFTMTPGNLTYLEETPTEILTDTLYQSQVTGTLELTGVEQEMIFEVEWELIGDRIQISGETSLLLSDFGIERPRAPVPGSPAVQDEIELSFVVTGKLIENQNQES